MGMIDIRQSTDADLAAVLGWLKAEYDQLQTGTGFWCNRGIIENAHRDERLLVCVEYETNEAVAFQVGGLISPGILEVRSDRRRKGYGRQFVEHCIEQARRDDECLLHIECNPVSSVPFWTHMGFRLYSDVFGDRCPEHVVNHAFRILDKSSDGYSSEGHSIAIDVIFRTECGVLLNRAQVSGILLDDGRVVLPHRIVSYCPCLIYRLNDTFVDVLANGHKCCSCKAKYPEAEMIGVERRSGEVYIIDELMLPDATAVSLAEGDRHES